MTPPRLWATMWMRSYPVSSTIVSISSASWAAAVRMSFVRTA